MAIDVTAAKAAKPSVSSAPRGRRANPVVRWVRRGGVSALLFFMPLLLVFGYFAWWPILRSLAIALQKTNLITAATWVGLDNFERVLADPLLFQATSNTGWFTILALVIGFPVPVLLATLVAEFGRWRHIASALAYLTVMVPPVVATLLWKQFYDPSETGLINTIIGWFGIGPVGWLQSPGLAMPSIVVQATWSSFGQTTIIYLAAITGIRSDLYEAAEIDGAGFWRRMWHVTFPQLRTVMLLLLLLQIIGTFQVFTEPFIMTGGGPENKTITLLMLIYRYAFIAGDYGKATALSLLLALFLGIVSAVYHAATRKWST